ncbi:hypothetical protein OG746_38535 [Streptomyces sp. NBC_01016]|nr:hypothetical protein [Streptomyces sp. NBC_01016]MCX4834602.1 hypothetical protein [Streptomyces sp. NBC_01016]
MHNHEPVDYDCPFYGTRGTAPQPDSLPAERRRAYAERLRAALKS